MRKSTGRWRDSAPIAGVYGVGWVLALVAALLVQAVFTAFGTAPALSAENARALRRVGRRGGVDRRRHVAVAGPVDDARQRAAHRPATARQREAGDEVRAGRRERSRSRCIRQLITEKPADLIVTPETAFPVLARASAARPARLRCAISPIRPQSSILFGAIGVTDHAGRPRDRLHEQPVRHHAGLRRTCIATTSITSCRSANSCRSGFRWFVDLMGIPLGDLRARRRRCRSRSSCTISRLPSISATKTFSAKKSRGRSASSDSARGHSGELDESRVVRRHHRARSASADRAHALARNRPADAARDQYRHDRRDRRERRRHRAAAAVHDAARSMPPCKAPTRQHAVCHERQHHRARRFAAAAGVWVCVCACANGT